MSSDVDRDWSTGLTLSFGRRSEHLLLLLRKRVAAAHLYDPGTDIRLFIGASDVLSSVVGTFEDRTIQNLIDHPAYEVFLVGARDVRWVRALDVVTRRHHDVDIGCPRHPREGERIPSNPDRRNIN